MKHLDKIPEQHTFDIWDPANMLVQNEFAKQNYKVVNGNITNGRCIIFFSGNGLYYPDEKDIFESVICRRDRYEWDKVMKARRITDAFEKIIFMRDIKKQWYVNGINQEADTADKTISLLKSLTMGFDTVTVGNSGGGYMAVLAGIKIHSTAVYSFSGQFDILRHCNEKNKLVNEKKDSEECFQYYDLKPLVRSGDTDIFFFYQDQVEQDIKQMETVRDIKRVICIPIKSDKHGVTIAASTYPFLFTRDIKENKALLENINYPLPKYKILELLIGKPRCRIIQLKDAICRKYRRILLVLGKMRYKIMRRFSQ